MIKYFIPNKIRDSIVERIEEFRFKNDYNKAIVEFNSSHMGSEQQLFHNILKLKASVTGEIYSRDVELYANSLLDSFNKMDNDVLEIKEDVEPMLLRAIEYCFNQRRIFVENIDENLSSAMIENYTIQYHSYEFLTKVDDTTDIDAIRNVLNKKLEPMKALTQFKQKVDECKDSVLTFSSWIGDLKVEAPIKSISINEDSIVIEIPYAVYELKKGANVLVHKPNPWDSYDNYEWLYVLNGNGEAIVGLKKHIGE